MKCDCIGKVESELEKTTGDSSAKLDLGFTLKGLVFPAVRYTYRKKKKDGSWRMTESQGVIIPEYCPFCGGKYDF